jgi:hypothetical protein
LQASFVKINKLDLRTNYWPRKWENGREKEMEKLNELECRQVKFNHYLKLKPIYY